MTSSVTSSVASLTERLGRCYSGAVYDVLRDRGRSDCVLPPEIVGLDAETRCCGPVFTLSGAVLDPDRDAATAPDPLEPWVRFLTEAPAGHVVICQPNAPDLAIMGELSAETLLHRGIRGYIVDGGSRDNSFIRRIGFPVFCKFRTPRDIVDKWAPDAMGAPITIGGAHIRTGDFVLADFDGAVIIPAELAPEVVTAVEGVMATEDKVRSAILADVDPLDAYRKYGKF